MIESKDISVIVQGAINKEETPKCLKSVRNVLPKAEIILSTWEGSDVSFLEGLYDVLLLNKDPGAGYYYKTETSVKYNNLNRQLVSTQEGLKKATRSYAMKIRSDIILTSDKFLKYFNTYPKRDENYKLFKNKILTSTVCARFGFRDYAEGNRIKSVNIAFHPSDWWFFGLKEDLITYFDVDLVKEPEFSSYYKLEENKDKFNPYIYMEEHNAKFAAEQYIASECFRKNCGIYIEHGGDISADIIEKSRKYMINNFIFLEYSDSGVYFNKYLVSKIHWLSPAYLDLYNKFRQEYEYQKYCDNDYKVSTLTKYLCENKSFINDGCLLLMHFQRAIGRKCENHNIITEIIVTIFMAFFNLIKHFKFILLLIIHNLKKYILKNPPKNEGNND